MEHRTGCSEPCPTWPGAFPGMGHPQLLMATLGKGIPILTENMKNDACHFRLCAKSREANTGDAAEKRESDLSFHGWKVSLSLPTLECPGCAFPLSPKSFAHTCPQMEDDCFNFCGMWFPALFQTISCGFCELPLWIPPCFCLWHLYFHIY